MRPLVKRQGGKYRSYKQVIDAFPTRYEDTNYVEPFVGGGSVFFNKKESKSEVLNDKDPVLMTVYETVKEDPLLMAKKVNGVYTKKDFEELQGTHPKNLLGRAVRDIILKKVSYLGFGTSYVEQYRKIDKDYVPYSERLKDTILHCEDYKKIVKEYDSPQTFFYLDPPYEGIRPNNNTTEYESDDISLEELADILSDMEGRFLLSINDSDTTRELFKEFNIKTTKPYARQSRWSDSFVSDLLVSNY
jgi:DNA adenine methylase